MDDRYLPVRNAANDFWTKIAYISLDASLSRRAEAIKRLDATIGDAKSTANVFFESKVHLADEALETAIGAAKATRDTACAGALEAFALSIEGPTSVLDAARKLNDEFFEAYKGRVANVFRLANALAQEEFEVSHEEAKSDEERESARKVLQSARQSAQSIHDESTATGFAMWNAKHREAMEAFNKATAAARATCREATEGHNKAFAAINAPAQQAHSTAKRNAYDEREARWAELDAERELQFGQIRSQYAIERRFRVAGLRTSRLFVDVYYNWLSAFTPPELKPPADT